MLKITSRAVRVLALFILFVSAAHARDGAASRDVTSDSLTTEVMFLEEGGMGADRALTLYDRVIGRSGEGSATLGRQPNVLVVRDTPARLTRFRALIRALDRPGAERRIYLRPMVHVAPSQMATLVRDLVSDDVRLVPDDRSGHLVVSATLTDYRRVDALVRKLDVPGDGGRRIRVTPGPSEGGFPP